MACAVRALLAASCSLQAADGTNGVGRVADTVRLGPDFD
jgi:hypothetical protein